MFFFFQAEDGIRDVAVTGVQTCALPIWPRFGPQACSASFPEEARCQAKAEREGDTPGIGTEFEIGRASCRERV